MKTQLRLNSIVPHGVGGPEARAINLIYTDLLNKFGQNEYNYIGINQIDEKSEELILKNGKRVHININYPASENFELESANEKNRIRLNIIHESLLRLAAKDKKLNIRVLEAIKNEILKRNFSFDFVYKPFKYKKSELLAKVIIHPEMDRFKFYILINDGDLEKCNLLIYEGQQAINIDSLFYFGKWKNENEIIITGKEKQVEIRIKIDKCKVEYVNLTNYNKAPLFEIMKANISKEDKEKAHQDWIHSLPPAIAAMLRDSKN